MCTPATRKPGSWPLWLSPRALLRWHLACSDHASTNTHPFAAIVVVVTSPTASDGATCSVALPPAPPPPPPPPPPGQYGPAHSPAREHMHRPGVGFAHSLGGGAGAGGC